MWFQNKVKRKRNRREKISTLYVLKFHWIDRLYNCQFSVFY